jgi:hypothetical protein
MVGPPAPGLWSVQHCQPPFGLLVRPGEQPAGLSSGRVPGGTDAPWRWAVPAWQAPYQGSSCQHALRAWHAEVHHLRRLQPRTTPARDSRSRPCRWGERARRPARGIALLQAQRHRSWLWNRWPASFATPAPGGPHSPAVSGPAKASKPRGRWREQCSPCQWNPASTTTWDQPRDQPLLGNLVTAGLERTLDLDGAGSVERLWHRGHPRDCTGAVARQDRYRGSDLVHHLARVAPKGDVRTAGRQRPTLPWRCTSRRGQRRSAAASSLLGARSVSYVDRWPPHGRAEAAARAQTRGRLRRRPSAGHPARSSRYPNIYYALPENSCSSTGTRSDRRIRAPAGHH